MLHFPNISLYISLGCSPLPVHRQGGFLFRAVRGGAAGGQGGHCHRGKVFFSFFFLKVFFRSRSCCSTLSFLFSFLFLDFFVPGHAAPRGQPEKELREGAHRAGGDQEGPHRTQAACGENFFLLFLLFLLIEHDLLVVRISFL